jgi:hypothetical protein
MGDGNLGGLRLAFNPQLRVEFRGATVTCCCRANWTSASA